MKNYLSLSNLSEKFTQIIPCVQSKKAKKVKKSLPFVILNSDNDYGFYVRRLVKEIQKNSELLEQPKILRKKSLKNIETGDLIVFGDNLGNVEYDYRIETDPKNLDHLDGRSFKVYDIINDFDKVIKRLKKYVAENKGEYVFVEEEETYGRIAEINIDVNVHQKAPKVTTPIAILRNAVCEEKVTIFDNWVKVGYNQYDIYVDLFGREIVYIDGNKFFVQEDRFGRKYLSK